MPRSLAAAALLALLSSAPLSSQSDSTPPPTTATASAPEEFHQGQWGVRFVGISNAYGAGALYFTSPRAAWSLQGSVNVNYMENDTDDNANEQNVVLLAGRRWYGERHSAVRSISGVGGIIGFSRGYDSVSDESSTGVTTGVYGELGGAVFFSPHLSLGATWRAQLFAAFYDNSSLESQYYLTIGQMALEGAFYF